MKKVSSCKWGANKRSLLTIYKALVRSTLEYGAIAFDSACRTTKKKLDSIQYQALKICTGAIQGTSLLILQNECGEMPLEIKRKMLLQKYAAKVKINKEHPSKEILIECWRLKTKKYKKGQEPIYLKTEELLKKTYWDTAQEKHDVPPPWLQPKVIIDTDLITQRNNNNVLDHQQINKKIEEYNDCTKIYTDASRTTEGRIKASIAYYITDTQEKGNYRISDNTTIFSAELLAIKVALEKNLDKISKHEAEREEFR